MIIYGLQYHTVLFNYGQLHKHRRSSQLPHLRLQKEIQSHIQEKQKTLYTSWEDANCPGLEMRGSVNRVVTYDD
jgi:hypothetical protein